MPSPDRPSSGVADSKYFIRPLKANFFWVFWTFSKATDYFNVKFYLSNACLHSVEHIHYFPQQIKRTDVWFQVSKLCFLFKPFNETFWNVLFAHNLKTNRFMNIFSWIVLKFPCWFSLKIFSFGYVLFLISLGKQ